MAEDKNRLIKAAVIAGSVIAGAVGINSSKNEDVDPNDNQQEKSELVESSTGQNDLGAPELDGDEIDQSIDEDSFKDLNEVIEAIKQYAEAEEQATVNSPENKMSRMQHFQHEMRLAVEIASGTNIEDFPEGDIEIMRGMVGQM